MGKTKQNIPKSERGGYDLWGKRPYSGKPQSSFWKRMCRRVERRLKRKEIKINISESEGIVAMGNYANEQGVFEC